MFCWWGDTPQQNVCTSRPDRVGAAAEGQAPCPLACLPAPLCLFGAGSTKGSTRTETEGAPP